MFLQIRVLVLLWCFVSFVCLVRFLLGCGVLGGFCSCLFLLLLTISGGSLTHVQGSGCILWSPYWRPCRPPPPLPPIRPLFVFCCSALRLCCFWGVLFWLGGGCCVLSCSCLCLAAFRGSGVKHLLMSTRLKQKTKETKTHIYIYIYTH